MGKKYQEEPEAPENHERWLLTYADLITLLLIFFIVMYTMAKVDQAKFEAVKQSLAGALKTGAAEIKSGTSGINTEYITPKGQGDKEAEEQEKMEDLEKNVNDLVNKHGLQGYITVTLEERGLDIEIRNELSNVILFNSGSANLNPGAADIIQKIGALLNDMPDNLIRVEGHTDNDPIHTNEFSSNWELSTMRATHVISSFVGKAGVNPSRLSAVGYGEYKAVAPNTSAEGKAKNRRVNIVIIKSKYNTVE